MPGAGGKGGKGGSSGQASNAALQDDEDVMLRRACNFKTWSAARRLKKEPVHSDRMLNYVNSPKPPTR